MRKTYKPITIDRLIQSEMIIHNIPASSISFEDAEYNIEALYDLKAKLNYAKDSREDLINKDRVLYDKFTNTLKPTNILRSRVSEKYNAQLVTRAWLKFYELIYKFELLDSLYKGPTKHEDSLYKGLVFMNAEFPGAGICALNHYAKERNIVFDWRASSFIPESTAVSNILIDTYGIYESNKDKWMMTETNNGDATDINNLLDLERRFNNSVLLYTHDAGIDVSDNFNEQESKTAKLHMGCVITGLLVLAKGGNLLGKQYSSFESLTVGLYTIYSSMFESFCVCKPITSGQSNSEVYIVGKGFLGMSKVIRDLLLDRLANFTMNPIISITSIDIDCFVSLSKTMCDCQIEYLEETHNLFKKYGSYGNLRKLAKALEQSNMRLADLWLSQYPIHSINESEYIPSIKKKNAFM